MRIFSFVRKGIDLERVEIEISLLPGLPNIHILGLPDAVIKESILRIKSALRMQEFCLPQSEQVVVNLRPTHEKKSSQGLDLAIAAAYLWKTGQVEIDPHFFDHDIYIYGEVGLDGVARAPGDIEFLESVPEGGFLIIGQLDRAIPFSHARVNCLKELSSLKWYEGEFDLEAPENSSLPEASSLSESDRVSNRVADYKFSPELADLLAIAATGEHNTFVAGPAGTGKTTFSEVLHALLRSPTQSEKRKIAKIKRITVREQSDAKSLPRPYVAPHHSISDLALLGGGLPPWPGEITRAQHGVLVLDEFLEFRPHVTESLREPIERHEITVSRVGARLTFPADFLLVGTSNLCPCGDFVPTKPAACSRSASYCKSYFRRLSGPLLDRFEMVSFSHKWTKKGRSEGEKVSYAQVEERVRAAQKFAAEVRGEVQMNSRLSLEACEAWTDLFTRKNLMPELPASHRRKLALMRVARSIADLEGAELVQGTHIEKSKRLTIDPYAELKTAQN